MNDERRRILERFFDGEPAGGDPRDAADDPEAQVYLRQLGLLRELSRQHDPAAAKPPRRPVIAPLRPRGRAAATALALAASVLMMAFAARQWQRAKREMDRVPITTPGSSPSTAIALDPTTKPRSGHLSQEVEMYRWANATSPRREDAARIVLSRIEPLRGRAALREVLALELANATPGSVPRLARSVSARAAATPGSGRRAAPSNRNRSLSSPRA